MIKVTFSAICALLVHLAVMEQAVLAQSGSQLSSPSAASLTDQADEAYRMGDYEAAERFASQALQRNSRDDVALYLRASARVERGGAEGDPALVRAGISDSRDALKIEGNPDYYLPYLYGMSRLATVEQRPEHARAGVDVADKALTMTGLTSEQTANFRFQRSLLNLALDDRTAAIEDLKLAVGAKPDHLAAQVALCNLYASQGATAEAEAQYARAAGVLSGEPLIFNNQGAYFQAQRRYDEAVTSFTRALQADPEYVPALTNRGFVRILQRRYRDAEQDLTKSLEIDPQQATAFGLRGAARLHINQASGAVQDYQTAATLNPDTPAAFYDLGFAQFFARDYNAASVSVDQALDVDPSIPFLAPWQYTSMVFSGKQDEAMQKFSGLESKAAGERTWFDLLTLYLMGKIEEPALRAAMTNENADDRRKQECEAHYFIGLRNASRQQQAEARKHFEQALASDVQYLSAYRGAMYAIDQFPNAQ
ncbi:MAG: tetratricopeptide repeat protein [Planctomycetaceae bacterium]